ncbi:hypothetical protein niasHS_017548 [Heterodera schachtii]|uniref:Uncharacterized protein n=1 Tax=Heterodera schachtii TaxID=97005 RepID=A0ABD2HW10_HETSC
MEEEREKANHENGEGGGGSARPPNTTQYSFPCQESSSRPPGREAALGDGQQADARWAKNLEMLGKLVSKFKRQTLQDGSESPPGKSSPPLSGGRGDGPMRRSARLNEKAAAERKADGSGGFSSHSPPNTRYRRAQLSLMEDIRNNIAASDRRTRSDAQTESAVPQAQPTCDSGTESDDDELEMLDSMSNTSMKSLSRTNGKMFDEENGECDDGFTGRSPPTLTSSPPLISEIDTSSWDSCGCESGIVLRDSAERDDASRNVDLLEAAFGGGELAIKPKTMTREGGQHPAGTTPVQSKNAFATHFRSMPIDFSALRNSELLLSDPLPGGDDAPTPIGSQRESGRGAILMDAHLARSQNSHQSQQTEGADHHGSHQGAFRRVLRRTRRNSNGGSSGPSVAARTISPQLSVGLGEKRRWGNTPNAEQQQQLSRMELSALPIAARTRGSLMGGAAQTGDANAIAVAAPGNELPRPVLTAARRTRVRVLYSSQQRPMVASQQQHHIGRHGQMATALGQSPPAMLFVANKRGRHSSKSSNSPHRPSLNFDKMRKRMLNGGGGANGPSNGGEGAAKAGDE